MTTQEIKTGLKFKHTATNTMYEVIKTSDVSVWYKALSRTTEWRVSKTTFLNKFKLGYDKCQTTTK